MKKYKKGTKFTVSNHTELCNKGWYLDESGNHYSHDDFPECSLSHYMIQRHAGQTLTVTGEDPKREDWYNVDENKYYIWPVATFLGTTYKMNARCLIGVHFTGMTPIDGWFICKHCGINLREIK